MFIELNNNEQTYLNFVIRSVKLMSEQKYHDNIYSLKGADKNHARVNTLVSKNMMSENIICMYDHSHISYYIIMFDSSMICAYMWVCKSSIHRKSQILQFQQLLVPISTFFLYLYT